MISSGELTVRGDTTNMQPAARNLLLLGVVTKNPFGNSAFKCLLAHAQVELNGLTVQGDRSENIA